MYCDNKNFVLNKIKQNPKKEKTKKDKNIFITKNKDCSYKCKKHLNKLTNPLNEKSFKKKR